MRLMLDKSNLDFIVTLFDYSNIQAYRVSDKDCELLALKAIKYGFKNVVVGPSSLPIINKLLKWSGVNIAVAIAYPSGAYLLHSKLQEIDDILKSGYRVDEFYMVLAIGKFLSGYENETLEELKALVKAAKGRVTKAVIEAAVMNKSQKKLICDMAAEAGVDYLVASTGFLPYDVPSPTSKDIEELVNASAGRLGIIACGEINTMEKALEMLYAGANRICTMKADEIIEALKNTAIELNKIQ